MLEMQFFGLCLKKKSVSPLMDVNPQKLSSLKRFLIKNQSIFFYTVQQLCKQQKRILYGNYEATYYVIFLGIPIATPQRQASLGVKKVRDIKFKHSTNILINSHKSYLKLIIYSILTVYYPNYHGRRSNYSPCKTIIAFQSYSSFKTTFSH